MTVTLSNFSTNEICYMTKHSAGFDIAANENRNILPKQWATISTGLFIGGWEPLRLMSNPNDAILYTNVSIIEMIPQLQILSRSGLASKAGVVVLNAPGLIDMDFKGELKVILINHGEYPFEIKNGDRIAQCVMSYVSRVLAVQVKDNLRLGGFGSTTHGKE